MARDRPTALILRRGPSDWYSLIRWDTARDTFENGAWMRGRIYEDRCDLSPNGELFLAFVHQGRKTGSSTTHAWTAISRSPWLHALALWPQGTTYGGGGRFESDESIVLRAAGTAKAPAGLRVTTGNPPLHTSSGEVQDAEWSGRDQQGRLVFTRGYAVYAGGPDGDVLLADLGDRVPAPQPAPERARTTLDNRPHKRR